MTELSSVYHNTAIIDDLKKVMKPEKKALYRDELNKKELTSRCEEISVKSLHDPLVLNKNDFLIARIFWDRNDEKYHDHWAFVLQR